jgi:hypothetical protein
LSDSLSRADQKDIEEVTASTALKTEEFALVFENLPLLKDNKG